MKPFSILSLILGLLALPYLTSCDGEADGETMRFFLERGATGLRAGSPEEITLASGVTRYVQPQPILMERNVTNVELYSVNDGRDLAWKFYFDAEGRRELYRRSVDSNGEFMVFMYDGVPVGARQLTGAIEDGTMFMLVDMEVAPGRDKRDAAEELLSRMQENIRKIQEQKAKAQAVF